MNLVGMGTMEVLVILLVAVVFLGPARMVQTARFIGKQIAELRRMTDHLSQLNLDQYDQTEEHSKPPQEGIEDSPVAFTPQPTNSSCGDPKLKEDQEEER